ncbi:hypothetical protein [Nocardioides flavescens]|uniref:Uncharacterized protein n=1 Tax=Nocardioides flavescens TaxID=2691959 RepID=A0A6L7EX98_9ACTN|nr:hypothetical protein [Nocardioides flavescens]MXG91430.1 hypothetical protein [Nocardioides flavescens]
MSNDPARPRARPRTWDALLLVAVALVLIVGSVYYGLGVYRDTRGPADERLRPTSSDSLPTAGPAPTTAPTTAPTPSPTETPTETPTADPAPARAGTCWDGRATPSLATCPLPSGTDGLAWVFPTFDPTSSRCRPAPTEGRAYAVTLSWTCTARVDGRRVTLAYDEVVDPAELAQWMVAKAGPEHLAKIDGARGGRLLMDDTAGEPSRITGGYARLPWAVSVFAPDPATARAAWDELVRQRAPQAVLGQP